MSEELKNNQENAADVSTPWDVLTEGAETEEEAPMEIDLKTPEYDALFAEAPLYIKKAKIEATQVTEEGLQNGEYSDKDVRFDEEQGAYVVDTYVMRENEQGERVAEIEGTRVVNPGDWLATNPKKEEGDHENNYPISDATFQKRYESTDTPGVYRGKGQARIIKNPTGKSVTMESPWGGPMNGDENCYFCDNGSKRYILSENDFAAYTPAEEQES